MGLVSIATSGVLNGVALLGYAALYVYVAPWHLPADRVVHVGDRHRRRRPALLLLSPDGAPGAPDLGHASGPPLQPVLQLRHRTAAEVEHQRRRLPAGAAAAVRRAAVDGVRQLLDQPRLPVLDPHRAHRKALAANRIRLQHAVAPPGAPRHGPAVPRQELRRHLDPVGSAVRQLPGRDRPAALRADQAGGHLQHLDAADPRVRRDRPRRPPRARAGATGSATSFGPPGWAPAQRRARGPGDTGTGRIVGRRSVSRACAPTP